MKSTKVLVIQTTKDMAIKVSGALEAAGYELGRASNEFEKAIFSMLEEYPELTVFVNNQTYADKQNPYLKILLAAYQYKRMQDIRLNSIN